MVIECVDSWLGRLQNGRACFALRHVLSRIFWCRQHRSGSSWLHFGQQSWTPHVPNSSEIRDTPLACIPPRRAAADATWRRAPRDVTTPPPPGERRRTSEQDADVEEFNLAVENVVVVRDVRHSHSVTSSLAHIPHTRVSAPVRTTSLQLAATLRLLPIVFTVVIYSRNITADTVADYDISGLRQRYIAGLTSRSYRVISPPSPMCQPITEH